MKRSIHKTKACIALPMLAFLALPLQAQVTDPADLIQALRAEIESMRSASASAQVRAQASTKELLALAASLAKAERALDAGRWLASLRPYAEAAESMAPALVQFKTGAMKDLEQLSVESALLRDELKAMGSPLTGRDKRPAALQAMLEEADSKAAAYLISSTEQGREAGLLAGKYYLKVARGQAELARLLGSLQTEAPMQSLGDLPGLTAFLDRLEAELLELYQPPLTQERHSTFINLSAGLKFAREMKDQDHRVGALRSGLRVARGIDARLRDAAEDAHSEEELFELQEQWMTRIEELPGDTSMPMLWLEEAGMELAAGEADLAQTSLLFDRVLVEYMSCLQQPDKPEAVAQVTVTVTLVRWPFT